MRRTPKPRRDRRRSAGHAAAARLRRAWPKIALLLVLAGLAGWLFHHFDVRWREIPGWLERVNRPVALLAMAFLPVVGFPISAVYLAAGAIFGPWIGGVVVAIVTLVHVASTYLLTSTLLRGPVERLRNRWRGHVPHVPDDERATLVAMVVIVPGPPYLARNCILALSGASLPLLSGLAVPLYVARSYVTILLGDAGMDPSRRELLILGGIFAVKLAISALLFERLRRRIPHAKAAGSKI